MIICVDFDGTCVSHEFPAIGKDIGAVPVLKELIANGHQLILWTMRSDIDKVSAKGQAKEIVDVDGGTYLTDAVNWFQEHDIPLYGINVNPDQHKWTKSPKAYGQLYIDDAALGCPLMESDLSERAYVNWRKVRNFLKKEGLIC